jgi:hypothetical protein
MRPTNRLFLFALIIFLLFGTVPVVQAVSPTTTDFDNASAVTCADPPTSWNGEIKDPNQVDYYAVDLVAGQVLTIDVDAEKIGSSLDSILEVFDAAGKLVAVSDESSNVPAADPARSAPGMDISPDPYLEMTVDVDGTYYLAISAETPGAGADTGSYTLLLQCSDQSTSPEFKWPVEVGDLLGATGSNTGSLINITPENAGSSLPFALGVGPITDIEFDPSSDLVFVAVDAVDAVDYIPARIVAIDPDSGDEVESYSLETESVVALEAAENMLYGVQVDPSGEQFSLVLVTFDDIALTATLTDVVSLGRGVVRALAYDQSEKVMYGASGVDLVKINLASPPIAIQKVTLTGLSSDIVALDFSNEDVLYGVDRDGNLFNVPIFSSLEAVVIGEPIDGVSGLTFVVGEPPDVDLVDTTCSSTLTSQMTASSEIAGRKPFGFKLKRHRKHRAVGFFKFQATAGESVTIRLAADEEIFAEAEKESTVYKLWKHWPKYNHKGRVFLGLRDAIPGVKVKKKKKGRLPLELTVKDLPADGWYYIMVVQPIFRFDKVDYWVDYHLTLDSSDQAGQACQTLEVVWPGDDAEEDFASIDESGDDTCDED